MREYLVILLPVVWLLGATIVGLILYKSSEAFFEKRGQSANHQKRIRIAGSALIAAIAFLGLRESTPVDTLRVNTPGTSLVRDADLMALVRTLQRIEDQLVVLRSCIAIDQRGTCGDQLTEVQKAAKEADALARGLVPAK
jgi:hypothetical protein